MNGRTFEVPEIPSNERSIRRERNLLSLSGGGYRGLFTASVLAALEDGAPPIAERFNYLAGTSIGGILAIGLACGKSGAELRDAIRNHGSKIFTPVPFNLGGLARSRYSSDGLRSSIEAILGKAESHTSFAEIPSALVICAVDEQSSRPAIFRTAAAAGGPATDLPIIDVALATSAAPTFFPPHQIGDRTFVDGGLVANAPDIVLLNEAWRQDGIPPENCHLLSIGTASSTRSGSIGKPGMMSDLLGDGGAGWLTEHKLIQLIMTAQERMVEDQVRALNLGTFIRIDETPENPIDLDRTDETTSGTLVALAEAAITNVKASASSELRQFNRKLNQS